MPAEVTGDRIPVSLRLLDHQIIGSDGALLGNVDDLVVTESEDGLVVSALMSGPPALACRQGGRGGRWLFALWRRLHPDADPQPLAIPLEHVTRLDSAVHVSVLAEHTLAQTAGLELWLREHVISRLPGALGGADEDRGPLQLERRRHQEFQVRPDVWTLSDLLGTRVCTEDGRELGEVIEVTADAIRRSGLELGHLLVRELVCSPRHLWQELGYTMEPQGPALLARLIRWWHKHDRRVDWADVRGIDRERHTVEVAGDARLDHPHDRASS
jgi:sporulation protein YlmC with PRC-barrel domain